MIGRLMQSVAMMIHFNFGYAQGGSNISGQAK